MTAAAVVFTFADPRIDESSSLVSTPSGDWLWTADDSGDPGRLFAVDLRGRTLGVAQVPGPRPVDVEDAAYGPDRTLYVGDLGDNRADRTSVTVLRVPEPAVDPRGTGERLTGAAPVRTVLTYEDGPHDAETLLVHPRTGQVLVVTKSPFGSSVYAAPQPFAGGVLRRVGRLPLRETGTPGGPSPEAVAQLLATGGAVSPDGRRVVVRTYTDAYVFAVPGEDLVAALRGTPVVVPLPATRQGEAVTWTHDGTALLTSSEGRSAPVHRVPVPAAVASAESAVESAVPSPVPSPVPSAVPQASPAGRTPGRPRLVPVGVGAAVVLLVVGLSRLRRLRRGRR